MVSVQQRQDYLFDLNGYRIIERAVEPDDVRAINGWIDDHPASAADAAFFERGERGKWIGNVEVQSYLTASTTRTSSKGARSSRR